MAMARREQFLALPIKGYAWLPDLRRRRHGQPVPMRLLGRPAVAITSGTATRTAAAPGSTESTTSTISSAATTWNQATSRKPANAAAESAARLPRRTRTSGSEGNRTGTA